MGLWSTLPQSSALSMMAWRKAQTKRFPIWLCVLSARWIVRIFLDNYSPLFCCNFSSLLERKFSRREEQADGCWELLGRGRLPHKLHWRRKKLRAGLIILLYRVPVPYRGSSLGNGQGFWFLGFFFLSFYGSHGLRRPQQISRDNPGADVTLLATCKWLVDVKGVQVRGEYFVMKIFPIWGICFWYKYSPSVTRRTRQCSSQVIIMNNGGHCQRRYGAVMPSIWGPRLQVNRFLSQQHKVASIYVYTLHLFYVLRYVQKFIFIKIARMCMNCPFCHVPPVSFETFFRSLFSV